MYKWLFLCWLVSCAHATTMTLDDQHLLQTQTHYKGVWFPLDWTVVEVDTSATLLSQNVPYGQSIEKGALLFELENPLLEIEYEEEQLQVKKLDEHYRQLEQWSSQPKVVQAQTMVEVLEQDCQYRKAKLSHQQTLVEMGGASKESLMSEQKALTQCHAQLEQATLSLEKLLRQGDALSLGQAHLKLKKQMMLCEQKKRQVESLHVKATHGGHLYDPNLFSSSPAKPVSVGQQLEAHQWLGVIAADDDFGILLEVDEKGAQAFEQATRIELVEKPSVQLDVISIAPKSIQMNLDKPTTYRITLRPSRPIQGVRFGTQLVLNLQSNERCQGWVIPQDAIHWDKSYPYLHTDKGEQRVRLGRQNQIMVEVIDGLNQGDVIELTS